MNQNAMWNYYQQEMPEVIFGQNMSRLEFCAHKIQKRSARVLNIGVGNGFFEEVASNLGMDVHTLDPDEHSIQALQQRLQLGAKAKVGYCQAIPFDTQYFDAVVISEVIEHLSEEDTIQTLEEIARVLVPGGQLIGTVPANENLALQYVLCPHCGELFHRWGHLQSFDVKKMRATLMPYFEIQEVGERVFVTWSALNTKGKFVSGVKLMLLHLGIHGSGEVMFFSALKKPRIIDA